MKTFRDSNSDFFFQEKCVGKVFATKYDESVSELDFKGLAKLPLEDRFEKLDLLLPGEKFLVLEVLERYPKILVLSGKNTGKVLYLIGFAFNCVPQFDLFLGEI